MMTAELHKECLASDWPPALVKRLKVKFSEGKLVIDIPPSLKKQVDALEYGTPSVQLTAALRRYGNRTDNAESFILKRANQLLGGN